MIELSRSDRDISATRTPILQGVKYLEFWRKIGLAAV